MRICEHCGEENPDNKNWCKKCMKPLRDDPAEALPLSLEKETGDKTAKFGIIRKVSDDSEYLGESEDIADKRERENHGRIYGSMGPKNRSVSEEIAEKEKSEEEDTSGLKGRIGRTEYGRGGSNSRIIRPTQRYCTRCSAQVDGADTLCQKCRNRKKKAKTIWLRVVAASLVVALLSSIAVHLVGNKSVNLTDEQVEISYQNYVNLSEEVNAFESKFTDEKGYVDIAEADSVLRSMADYAKQLHKEGKITDYSYRNGDSCIYMEVDGWLGVLYEPKIEGYLSGGNDIEILTMEPYADEVDTFVHYVLSGADGPDEGAELIAQNLNGFSFTKNLNNDDVTVETIRNLPDHSIILLTGHGNYTNVGPVICVGKVNDLSFAELYEDEIADGAMYVSTAGTIYITPIFVEKYMSSDALKGSIVYFNSCYSYTDNKMADSIMRKGALAYLGNTNKVQGIYGFNAIYAFLEGLTPVATGSYCKSIQEALDYAKLSYAKDWTTGSIVNICKAYDFSLPEMIALKDGTYDIKENGVIRVFDTDGNPCKNYTMYIAKASNLNEIYLENGADVTPEEVILYADETRTINSKLPQKLNLDSGIYEIAFVQDDNLDNLVVHTFQVFEDKGNKSISVQLEFRKDVPTESPTVTPTEVPTKDNVLSGKCGDNLMWTLENGVLTISGRGRMYDYNPLNIPAKPTPWHDYAYNNEITAIQIGDGVTYIGSYAFACCWNIDNIRIPGNVKEIGEHAFHACSNYPDKELNVIIEDGVEIIGDGAFFECFTMMSITLPESVTYIGNSAFWNCRLTSITIPKNVTYIGSQVFYGVNSNTLQNVYFTGNAPQFADDAFLEEHLTAYYPGDNATWTRTVMKDYGGHINWVKEHKPIILGSFKNLSEAYTYAINSKPNDMFSYGMMEDIDRDGTDELILGYCDSIAVDGTEWAAHCYSIYDYENGKLICSVDKEVICYEVAGNSGRIGVVYYKNKPTLMCKKWEALHGTSGDLFENYYTLYDPEKYQPFTELRVEQHNEGNIWYEYYVDNSEVTQDEFEDELKNYKYLTLNSNGRADYSYPEKSFDELKEYLASLVAPQTGMELAAYKPILEKAMKNSGYDANDEYTHSYCEGILVDLDGDNVKELVLKHFDTDSPAAGGAERLLSVYDYENNKVVTRLNKAPFGEFGFAGSYGYASVVYRDGNAFPVTYYEVGETSADASIGANMFGVMTVYDGENCKKLHTYRIDRDDGVISCEIDDKAVSEHDFINYVEQYEGIKVVCDVYELIKLPDTFITAADLMKQLK